MILYFSGTGNTRYAARGLAKLLGDEAVSMNSLIRTRTHKRFYSERPYVICAPIYAWRFPRIVESFIRRSDFWGSDRFYFVATCDSQTGGAAYFLKKICEEKSVRFCGFSSVAMPENYIVMYDAPSGEEQDEILSVADEEIKSVAQRIREGELISDSRKMPFAGIASRVLNPFFYSFFVGDRKFRADSSCVSCGKCTEVCPFNNISLKDGRPVWNSRCTHCMACICVCPVTAIEYGGKTEGKERYINLREFSDGGNNG